MNDTEFLFTTILAAAIGYAIAYCMKHIGYYWNKWGIFICYFVFPTTGIVLLMSAAMIADKNEQVFSIAFVIGFVVGLIRPKQHE